MNRPLLITAIALISSLAIADSAEAHRAGRPHRHPHGNWNDNNGWHNDWENRRDARRAGVLAGVVTAGVVGAAASANVHEQYEECMIVTGYDYACERQRYEDAERARRRARRSVVIVGVTTRAIVRDLTWESVAHRPIDTKVGR